MGPVPESTTSVIVPSRPPPHAANATANAVARNTAPNLDMCLLADDSSFMRAKPRVDVARSLSEHLRSLHESRFGLVEIVELLADVVADCFDAVDRARIECGIVRAFRWTAGNLEHRVEPIVVGLSRLGICPRPLPRERAVLRPETVRQRHRANFVSRHRRVDAHGVARDLLLDRGVRILAELHMPQRVVTKLEPLIREPFHFCEAPFLLLALELLAVAEEVMARGADLHPSPTRPV